MTRSLRDCRVLVVDDSEPMRRLIGGVLAAAGITAVTFAEDGVAAFERIAEAMPDLVILDIMMPRMDGFEVCSRLRAEPQWQRLPILVETALGSPEERTQIFRAGATDVITKPIHGPELISRVKVHLENRLLVASLESFQERMGAELRLARSMQEAILPRRQVLEELSDRHSLVIQAHVEPSSEVGGDHWGIHSVGDDQVALYSVDFTGHGVTAALNTFRLHTLMHRESHSGGSPAAYLSLLNHKLAELLPTGQFATLLYGVIDLAEDTFTYASAAAPHPVIWDGIAARALDGSGLPAGIAKSARYEDRLVSFPPGSALLLYSDALIETPDDRGGVLSEEDVSAMVSEARLQADPLKHITAIFRDGRHQLDDDLTLIWISRMPENEKRF